MACAFPNTQAHLLRSVIEGLAFELNRHLGFLRAAGMQVNRLLMTGGAATAKSPRKIIAIPLASPCGPVWGRQ